MTTKKSVAKKALAALRAERLARFIKTRKLPEFWTVACRDGIDACSNCLAWYAAEKARKAKTKRAKAKRAK